MYALYLFIYDQKLSQNLLSVITAHIHYFKLFFPFPSFSSSLYQYHTYLLVPHFVFLLNFR